MATSQKFHDQAKTVDSAAHRRMLTDIHEVNLSYLLLTKQLLDSDFDDALCRCGISEPTGRLIASMDAEQLMRLSRTPMVLPALRLTEPAILAQIGASNPRERIIGQVKAIVALSQESASCVADSIESTHPVKSDADRFSEMV